MAIRNKLVWISCASLLSAFTAVAQTTVTTTDGTANQVVKFSGSSTVINSAITESGGKVGIGTGTTTPGLTLTLGTNSTGISLDSPTAIGMWTAGTERLQLNGANGLMNLNSAMWVQGSGNVGIGTTTPGAPLHINSSKGLMVGNPSYNYSNVATDEAIFAGSVALQNMANANWIGIEFKGANLTYSSSMFVGVNPSVGGGELQFLNATSQPVAVIEPGGNVGIGTTTPGAMLEVHGNVLLSAAGATITFADGTPQSTAWTGVLCGGDYAESVGMSDDRTHYEPGDLIVVDSNSPGKFLKSAEPYSTLVAGIYSTKPGVVGRRTTDPAAAKEEIPMAMIGIVPAKVSAENGPVKAGDLLVASSTPGYAMKGTDHERMMGAVVGKALGVLQAGTGVINVLVTLQ